MFTLEEWISPKKVEKIKTVAEESHIPEGMKKLIDSVIEQLDATEKERERIEEESLGIHNDHRQERDEEENIYSTIEEAVNEVNLEEQPLKTLKKLLNYLNRIYVSFKNYDALKKQEEKKFVNDVYKNTFFTNKLTRAGNSASNLASIAKKSPSTQTGKKIKACTEIAEKEILKPLIAGLQNKEKKLLLDMARSRNEKNFRKFYDKQVERLGKINKILKGEDVPDEESHRE